MGADVVRSERRGPALWLIIDRPERRNALSAEVIGGLLEGIESAAADPDVRVVVLTGAGDRAFCAGADLAGTGPGVTRPASDADDAATDPSDRPRGGGLADLLTAIVGHPDPVVARVKGLALAGGFGLALACDLIVAADTAEFGTPEVNVGLWPFMITAVIQRTVPRKVAVELMMTGRRMSADEAGRWGIVNRVVPAGKLDEAVDALVEELASKSPLVLRVGKESFRRAEDMSFGDALQFLQEMLEMHLSSEDAAEGVAAFLARREPNWSGR
jgi:enoyl-CoA hydratase